MKPMLFNLYREYSGEMITVDGTQQWHRCIFRDGCTFLGLPGFQKHQVFKDCYMDPDTKIVELQPEVIA